MRRRIAGALLAALVAAPFAADATRRDPTAPRPLIVGAPPGPAPMNRFDGARTARTSLSLPRHAAAGRRVRLSGDAAGPLAVDAGGRTLVVTSDRRLVQLGSDFRVEWSRELDGPSREGAVLTSAGARVTVTETGTVSAYSTAGRLLYRVNPAGGRGGLGASPLAARDGSVVIAFGATVLSIDDAGAISATTEVGDPVTALTEGPDGVFLITEDGDVFSWRAPLQPKHVGNLGGRPSGEVTLVTARTLVAVVRETALVELDTGRGERRIRASTTSERLLPGVAVAASGEVVALTDGGQVRTYDSTSEVRSQSVVGAAPGARGPAELPLSPPWIDGGGTIAFLGPGARLSSLGPGGESRAFALEGCGAPLSAAPLRRDAIVVACASGLVLEVVEASPLAAPGPERAPGIEGDPGPSGRRNIGAPPSTTRNDAGGVERTGYNRSRTN